jgi:hypothetical protein
LDFRVVMTAPFLLTMVIADGAIRMDDNFVGVVGVEMEDSGLGVVDPDDGVIMALHDGLPLIS